MTIALKISKTIKDLKKKFNVGTIIEKPVMPMLARKKNIHHSIDLEIDHRRGQDEIGTPKHINCDKTGLLALNAEEKAFH